MIQIIDTSVYQRHIHNTNAWVETDIIDSSGYVNPLDPSCEINASCHYKHFGKYDTLKIAVDPSIKYEFDHRTRPDTHLYVDPSIKEMMDFEFQYMYSTDGSLDRKKFPF